MHHRVTGSWAFGAALYSSACPLFMFAVTDDSVAQETGVRFIMCWGHLRKRLPGEGEEGELKRQIKLDWLGSEKEKRKQEKGKGYRICQERGRRNSEGGEVLCLSPPKPGIRAKRLKKHKRQV